MIRFVDFFAGIGGIRIGFEQTLTDLVISNKCVLSSEIDERARETYALNFGEFPQGDLYKISEFPDFDFLLAGFPCQPFSYAGKQKGFGDTRGTLFFEIERLLGKHRPKGFLLENVRGLLTHDNGRTFATIIQNLEDLGYKVQWRLLNSSEFNVPQNRVRVYIVGLRDDDPILTIESNKGSADSHLFKNKQDCKARKLVADILESDVPESYDCSLVFQSKLMQVVEQKKYPFTVCA